ncbi:MAG: O-antigen ligase family protein [Candidatus Gottesmanbacteria bacterium]|nr:O-antigen ligase family protein [Candidatus Gottesmanbacteria bacterium]
MKKVFSWCKNNILFLFTLFLLGFIPLYPKLPLVDIKNVWVYVRLEDFVVLFMLLWWMVLVVRKSLPLRTPLTVPILMFWLVGAITTIHGILLVFPGLANVFPNVALLSYLRHIEYMSLFFIGYHGMKEKRFFSPLVVVLTVSLCLVLVYGIGQKYFSFPAFLTMNEQFAKGVPIQLSSMSRISSTFGGHYDLAAYLVLVLPIMVSLVFGYKNWFVRLLLLGIAAVGLSVLFMTVSRISLFALFVSLGVVILLHRKKLVIISIPILLVAVGILFVVSPSLLARYGNTIKEINILVDTKTGEPIGHVKDVSRQYFEHKVVKQEYFGSIFSVLTSSPSASMVIPNQLLPERVILLQESDAPTGENLPQGTGYINLSLSPVVKRLAIFYFERKPDPITGQITVTMINGDYLLKRAAAYDLSFTTRFQGEWPQAIDAFKRNVLFGSGYGSVSLAVDNNYLRMLGEVGALGFVSFLTIFIALEIYIRKVMPAIESPPVKSFIIGFVAGLAGLAVNAIFIDVFEASKIAFLLWLLMGAIVSLMHIYKNITFDYIQELKKVAFSTGAIIVYLGITAVLLYSLMTRNYFVGDDFTWFRWVADGRLVPSTVLKYFTGADGFFYRPGAKLYFSLMYSVFWLNQVPYHIVSLTLHFIVSVLVFLLAKKIVKHTLLSALAGFLFLILSGLSEAVFWISATGFLFTASFSLAGLLCYIAWLEKKKTAYFIGALCFSMVAPLFHELGIVTPLLFLVYRWTIVSPVSVRSVLKDVYHRILFLPIPVYLMVRFFAHSHWLSGDYNYNLVKLPFNAAGNAVGYVTLTLFGPLSLPVYQAFRMLLREHAAIAVIASAVVLIVLVFVYRKAARYMKKDEMNIFLFGTFFFLVALLPFLGLGNISSRYSYLGSVGVLFLFILFIKKFAAYLLTSGRDIAVISTMLVMGLFSLLHIVQLQQIHSDWYEAGEKARRFIVSIDSEYHDSWANEPLELHFVNVPIRLGEAWVFPVGIRDALWLVYRNPNVKIYTWPIVTQAFRATQNGSFTQKIFVFDDTGKVTLVNRPLNVQ